MITVDTFNKSLRFLLIAAIGMFSGWYIEHISNLYRDNGIWGISEPIYWFGFLFSLIGIAVLYWEKSRQKSIAYIPEIVNPGPRSGYVYLIKGSRNLYKIGRSKNPHDRIHTFNVKLPFDVSYEHLIACANMYEAERLMHQVFKHRRVDGEWFCLSNDDVKFIKSFCVVVEAK